MRRAEELHATGQYAEACLAYEAALRDRQEPLDPGQVPMVLRRVARCYSEMADWSAAEDCLDVAEIAALGYGDALGVAHATNARAVAAQQYGDLDRAEALYLRAYADAANAGSGSLLAMLDQNLGTIANIRGDLAEARRRYFASLAGYRALKMDRLVAEALNNLGMLFTDLRDWRSADASFTEAVVLAQRTGESSFRMRVEANRVELYLSRKRFRKARRLARRLVLMQTGDAQWIGETYKHLGVASRALGDVMEAERCLAIALGHAERRHDLLLTAETLRELAVVYQVRQRNREMLQALNRSHSIFTQLSATRDISDVRGRVRRLEDEFLKIVEQWGSSIESADHYTQGHCERVAAYACALARDAGLDAGVLLWFRMGALLHDVGKITIPAEILNKPGGLTEAETALMREHATRGDALLSGIAFPWDIRPMVRHHHERWDGYGYPDRLASTQIPRAARILCIADVFDALTSTRSYREAYSPVEAAEMMRADAGRAFDPELLHVFMTKTLPRVRLRGRTVELSTITPREPVRVQRAAPSVTLPPG